MKLLTTVIVVIFLSGFITDNPSPIDPTLIVGKWRLEKTVIDGEVDTTHTEIRTIIYTYRSDDSVIMDAVWQSGDTGTFKGTYNIRPKNRVLTMKFDGASGGDNLIQELTTTSLIFIDENKRRGNPTRIETHYTKIK